VRARRVDRQCRCERVHTVWCVGSPAETRPGGSCGAGACRAHARTPRQGCGTVAHSGGTWRHAHATSRKALSRPGPSEVPLFACTKLKKLHVNFTTVDMKVVDESTL
jgi:hypothetical protein